MATSSTALTHAIADAKRILGALRRSGRAISRSGSRWTRSGWPARSPKPSTISRNNSPSSTAELEGISAAVGKEGKIDQRLSLRVRHRRVGRPRPIGQFAHRRSDRTHAGGGTRHRGCRPGRPVAEDDPGDWRSPTARGVTVDQRYRGHHGGAARLVRLGSDSGGARGGDRGQAGRPGPGPGGRRHLEGPHRQRQLDGGQPHRPGAQHRRGHHRRGERRPLQEDYGRRQGRDPRAEEHHQHHGGPAPVLRRRGDAGGARGGDRGQAGRPG